MLLSFYEKGRIEAGCDEAGRGCLAGPVFAAAVILPPDFHHPMLNDSKQLTEHQRVMLRPIIEREAIAWAVAEISPKKIDEINILWASVLGMHEAIDQLKIRPNLLLIDGNRFRKYHDIEHLTVVKGDSKYASIAAASVLAKTWRDEKMAQLDADFPQYFWKKNKGYPAPAHRAAIRAFGSTEHHRMTFRLLPDNIQGVLF
jgi:ribonuclease HII